MTFDWTTDTSPFADAQGNQPARFVLRQIGDSAFEVTAGFRYEPPGEEPITVDSKSLVSTDLASIPLFMAWFVPVNGRHTPAALVHDQLVAHSSDSGAPTDARADADDTFLAAMTGCDVAILRRNLMYTAVTAATRFTTRGRQRVGMMLWGLAALTGTVALIASMAQGRPVVALAAVLAPIIGSALWGVRNWRQGLLAGYAVWLVIVPAATTLAGYGLYWICEQVVRLFAARGATPLSQVPPPVPLR